MNEKEIARKIIRKAIHESFYSNLKNKIVSSTKNSWGKLKKSAERETAETKAAAILIGRAIKGDNISKEERKFILDQSLDIGKIFLLLGMQTIPASSLLMPTLVALQKKYPKSFNIFPKAQDIPKTLTEAKFDLNNCPLIKTNYQVEQFVKQFVKQFKNGEELLRRGGLPNDMLDFLAFGVKDGEIKRMSSNEIKIKWKDDIENVLYEIKYFAKKNEMNIKEAQLKWAKMINLSTPIDVRLENDNYYIEDGHHRYMASKLLNKKVLCKIEVFQNPIIKLASDLDYDNFHRCLFKQIVN